MLGITRRSAVLGAAPTPTPGGSSFDTVWEYTGTSGTAVYGFGDIGGAQYTGIFPAIRSTTFKNGGKYYYELEKLETTEWFYAGFCDYNNFNAANPELGALVCWYSYGSGCFDTYDPSGVYSQITPIGSLSSDMTLPGTVLQLALDLDNGMVTVGANNIWLPPVAIPWLIGRDIAIFMACPSSTGDQLKLMMRTAPSEFINTPLPGYLPWDEDNIG